MARWDDDDYWDDADELQPHAPPRRPFDDDSPGTVAPALLPRPIHQEMVGSIYKIPDDLWGFDVPDRDWHPGACVSCDLAADSTFCYKGTDARGKRVDRAVMVIAEPTEQNGLKKATAFALEPRRIRLYVLRKIHNADGWLGALEPPCLGVLQARLAEFRAQSEEAEQ